MLQLRSHSIDLVLSNQSLKRDAESAHQSHLLNEQPVSLVSRLSKGQKPFRFPEDFRKTAVLLPSLESDIRSAFDLILDQAGVRPIIAAEVDDMAMLRVLALRIKAVALVPRVVVQDELRSGVLVERFCLRLDSGTLYAITPTRTFPNLLVKELIEHARPFR